MDMRDDRRVVWIHSDKPDQRPISAWMQRSLHERYASVLKERLPDEWVWLIRQQGES